MSKPCGRCSCGYLGQVAVALLGVVLLVGCDAVLTPPPSTPTLTPNASAPSRLATPTIAPEIYLTPVPPTPTFTPSPTPTPVIHVVESGDTLFGIALEYGVTVGGLLRANGLAEQDILSIGQALIIPLEEEEIPEAGYIVVPEGNAILPTPTPMPLTTSGVAIYETPVGGIWCMGEVVNTTGDAVTNIQVEVTLVAADGTPIVTTRALVAADYLPAEARAPFSILFRDPPSGVTDALVRLVRGESVSPITAGFVPLQIAGAEGGVSGPQYRVRGTVVNAAAATVGRVSVVATIYNTEGNVVGYRQLTMAESVQIASGAQQTFDILLTPQEVAAPSGYSVIAWGVAN
ncbi:MAG: LysM peptidoglycan-binding domain-containing protein [Anaerolineae bacterium]|nr:LysM peptidoglycan-binding domain-containing protein [Anaerolineae bacterium]